MKPQTIQLIARIVGSIFGLSGLCLAVASLLALFGISFGTGSLAQSAPPFWLLLGGAVLVRAGYLVWFGWSPLAVRHVVGDTFFFILLFCLFYAPFHAPSGWGFLGFLAALLVCYGLYWLVAMVVSRYAFPPSTGAQESGAAPQPGGK